MFKNLREKITTSDSSNRKKLSNNNEDSIGNDHTSESKNTGFQNLSRFSSISSLVSDVSSAFSKSMTTPQHIQPSFHDNESISEYDDSVAGGDTFSKEELYQRFQRARLLAKRYKTRYLEVSEANKKLELDNSKMSQALSDSQDKQIRRINELKEQIELDKKAKTDVEENYMLMMEENTELVNVLKLQISLLKEGKDLPPELEQQIKAKHEIQIQIEKKKEEEIKDLKSVLAQRDNLLHRCKEKINSLNSKLSELEMKYSNVTEVSISSDDSIKPAEKDHSEIIKNLSLEFEERKLQYESEMITRFNEKFEELKFEEQKLKEKIRLVSEENESLVEQLDIKSKIVQDLIQNSEGNLEEYYYDADKLKQCHLIVQKYPKNANSIINELSRLFDRKSEPRFMAESAFGERDEQIFEEDLNESSQISDLEEQNRFLLSKIEQLENTKSLCEEENHNRERELKQSNSIIEDERKNYVLRSISLNGEINNLKVENEQLICENQETHNKLSEFHLLLSKTEGELKNILQENEVLQKNNHLLEQNVSNMMFEKSKLIQDSHNLCDDFNTMEQKLASLQKEYENNQLNLAEKKDECKLLNDRIDELMESVNQTNAEKKELLQEINKVHIDTSTQEQISLNMLEMQQRFEQEIVELKNQIVSDNNLQLEKSAEIVNLMQQIDVLRISNENFDTDLEDLTVKNSNLIKENENLLENIKNLTEENQLNKCKLEELIHENAESNKSKMELAENLENQNTIVSNCRERMEILQLENEHLIEKISKISEDNNLLMEKSAEIENLMQQIDLLRISNEKSDNDLEDLTTKNSNLIKENENLLENMKNLTEENQFNKCKLEGLMDENAESNKNKMELAENLEKQNTIVSNCRERIEILQLENEHLTDKISKISEECEQLSANFNTKSQLLECEIQEKLLITNQLKSLESIQTERDENVEKQKILTEEIIILKDIIQSYKENESKTENKSEIKDNDHVELANENHRDAIKEFEKQIEEHLKTISCNEETINSLNNLIEDKTAHLHEEVTLKNEYNDTVKLMELHLPKFCDWIENSMNMVITNDIYSPMKDTMTSAVYWNSEIENECSNCNTLVAAGKTIDKLLLMSHQLFTSLQENRKRAEDSINSQIETQKILDRVRNEVTRIFTQISMNTDDKDDELFSKLDSIGKALKIHLEEKNEILADIKSLYSFLSEKHTKSDVSLLSIIPTGSHLYDFVKRIDDLVLNFKRDLSTDHELNTKLRAEYEILDGKLEKSNALLLKLFKQLINIFRFTDLSVTTVADINKSARQGLIKGLKDFVKTQEQLKSEVNQLRTQLIETKNELKDVVEINVNIEKELGDLKTSVENDRDRLIATGEELENSIRQLNEVVDEKGRIDEEKQSLRKKLKELNENICSLKLEFENQSLENRRLEIQFDEFLEKIKSNHLTLEEIYKKELEKGRGYQRNLEEEITTTKESNSRMLSESEKKLEEVLNQSEQLLELNYQYKKLLDESKVENLNVLGSCAKLENENSVLQCRINELDVENKQFGDKISDIQRLLNESVEERDKLRANLTDLENESRNFTETVKNLQMIQENKDGELGDLTRQLGEMKSANQNLLTQIETLEHSNRIISEKEKSINVKSLELAAQQVQSETNLRATQHQLESSELNCRAIGTEKNELQVQLNDLQTFCTALKSKNCEMEHLIATFEAQIEDLNLEMEQIKANNEIEIEEIKEQFLDEKSNIEDDYNRKIKKLAKEFNDQINEKERDFQKTFEEALSSIRTDESRVKNDLKSTIDELNRSTIELESERNQLLDTISENDITIKKLRNQIECNERDLESSKLKIEDFVNVITKFESEKERNKSKKASKMNQTVDTFSCYEETFLNGVTIKDHEVLLMHCSDIEGQLKQLQSENIELKKCSLVEKPDSTSTNTSGVRETPVSAHRTNQFYTQPSGSHDISKSGILFQGTSFRSPNTSCSDFPFCPVPITEATDYEYLHDVLLKYMTGLETEILAKVVCTVMKFSHEETSRVLLFEQDRNKFIRRIL